MLVLASASPRRALILSELGLSVVVDPAHVPEDQIGGENSEASAVRLAAAKAAAVAERRPGDWILAADTLVELDGAVLEKPRDDADAARMLRRLSGREHRVVTAVRLRRGPSEGRGSVCWSAVRFAPLSEEEIAWYVATGEPRDKAGAYGVQGLGARFIESIAGSYTNVMGLPARDVYRLMREAGADALASLALPEASSP
jgi:septum formation protein